MSTITIRRGEVTATCETAETAVALIRALEGTTPAATPTPAAPARRSRKAEPAAEVPTSGRGAIKAAVLAAIRSSDGEPDWSALAMTVYGSDSSVERNRLKVCLTRLLTNGDVKRRKTGGYEVR
jgi:hypothetical protein